MKRLCAPLFLFASLAPAFGQGGTPPPVDVAHDAAGIFFWIMPLLIGLIPLVLSLILMFWVGSDAGKRDIPHRGLCIRFVFLAKLIEWLNYLLIRPTTA